jgi:hypothetical protein
MDKEKEYILSFFYTNLDTIGKIEEHDKLYIDSNNMIKIDESYMFQGLWRYCNNISRNDALHVLNKLLNDIDIYFNAMYIKNIDSKNNIISKTHKLIANDKINYETFNIIVMHLNNSIKGIENLKKTYQSDIETCKELNKIINKIKSLSINFANMIL